MKVTGAWKVPCWLEYIDSITTVPDLCGPMQLYVRNVFATHHCESVYR